ncbi:MAG: helix-turn-helix domain-containing protein [Geminicoccaceae bacterium]|nr:helix-turn-helix domain-containing protein [Geminicoccaceae bacterium]
MNPVPFPEVLHDQQVIDLATAARMVGISHVTLRREIAAGRGPKIVRPSPRRVGVRVADLRAWLEARSSSAA